MRPFPPSSSPAVAARAAAAAAQAVRLRDAGRSLRRLAGAVRYHPVTGERPALTAALDQGLAAIEGVLDEIQRGASERASDESALAPHGDAVARQLRRDHQAIEHQAQVAAAAVAALRGVLASPDDASLDAPYGHGAPRRHHPGALCTIVAARAESLAAALESAAIAKLNLTGGR